MRKAQPGFKVRESFLFSNTLGSPGDTNVPRPGSPRDKNVPRAGSPGDTNVPRAGSPRDKNVPRAGSPGDKMYLGQAALGT